MPDEAWTFFEIDPVAPLGKPKSLDGSGPCRPARTASLLNVARKEFARMVDDAAADALHWPMFDPLSESCP
ncbi:MAG TPA: hypothetical protein VG985_01105 [Xanthobacteraceae bacterium]|nr:hypothetical protein [Xanthobacteraceae bacterium]